ncbi:MAG: class I SAM-dependent methyltransferase [Treponema sp.]|nr:class I SAM-dependent methyltransferase [Treponema sp.]
MENTADKKLENQKTLFANRIGKQYRLLRKWARKNRISCYRLYDRDIPEIPLSVDLYTFVPDDVTDKYQNLIQLQELNAAISKNDSYANYLLNEEKRRTFIHLYLYERPYEKPEEEEKLWLEQMVKVLAQTLEIDESHVITKTRKKLSGNENGRTEQYEKIESSSVVKGIVQEQGQLFNVNLSEYLDTGLFFDHRPLRDIVRSTCSGKSVLNLFCYTGSFSVYAAEGKARRVESVDMSKTYLEWAKENMRLNGFEENEKYIFTRQDAIGFINQKNAEVPNKEGTNRFDIIILDPPTFSNSKRTDNTLDINRDWSTLANKCIAILKPKGILYFSTNSRRLSFDASLLQCPSGSELAVQDISAKTVPDDYRNAKIHRTWKISVN